MSENFRTLDFAQLGHGPDGLSWSLRVVRADTGMQAIFRSQLDS